MQVATKGVMTGIGFCTAPDHGWICLRNVSGTRAIQNVATQAGLEPATYGLTVHRSTN